MLVPSERQFVTVASTPLKLTVLVPCELPKPVPVMVTLVVPAGPEGGEMLVMLMGEQLCGAAAGGKRSPNAGRKKLASSTLVHREQRILPPGHKEVSEFPISLICVFCPK